MTTPVYKGTLVPLLAARESVQLVGRAGYSVELQPGAQAMQYAWQPEVIEGDPRAFSAGVAPARAPAGDLDLQIMWLRAVRPANNPPLVYWRIEYSHGEVVYDVPQHSSLGAAAPQLFQTQRGWVLPQRGLRVRFPSRAFKLWLYTPPETEPPPEPTVPGGAPCTLQLSTQPCSGVERVRLPMSDLSWVLDVATPTQLPLGATEMRFGSPITGLAFAGAETIQFFDVTGEPVGTPVALALLGGWVPIPHFAAFWVALDEATQVSYQ